jgi:histidinol phosphatase-like enzyme
MVHQLLQHFEVDLENSFFAGDTWRDIECAKKVGIKSYGIHGGAGFPYPPESEFFSNQPFCFASSLFEAVQTELKSAPYSP